MMNERLRYTMADVHNTYGAQRARDEWYGDWASALIYRPLSFWLTLPLLNLSIGANAITASSIVLALSLPFVAVLLGSSAPYAIAAIGFCCMVLDCVDGNLARVYGTSTETGAYLDFLGDIVYRIAMYATVGYLADASGGAPAVLAGYAFPAAALAACVALAARLCRFREGRSAALTFHSVDKATKADTNAWVVRFIFPVLSGTDRILPLLVFATALLGMLKWLVLWLLVYSIADFLYTQILVNERLRARR